MRQQEKCKMLEQRALSLGDFEEMKEHASGCSDCRERLRILEMIADDSNGLNLRLDRRNIAQIETALSKRPSCSKFTLLRLSYALQFISVIVALIVVIYLSSYTTVREKTYPADKDLFSWEMKYPTQDIGRRINNALKAKPIGNKGLNTVSRETNSLKRKVIELRKSIEKV